MRSSGFTLVELLVVMAVIAIVASLAIPNLLRSRMDSNESAAIATLKSVTTAQAQCQASLTIDVDHNGSGEFGWFGELAGRSGIRIDQAGGVSPDALEPPTLSGAFGALNGSVVYRSGYLFAMYLPDATNVWQAENPTGGGAGVSTSATYAETHWCCYAWPAGRGTSGNRAFFVNERGEILATRNRAMRYSAAAVRPAPDAAVFAGASTPVTMASPAAVNATGRDGQFWTLVN